MFLKKKHDRTWQSKRSLIVFVSSGGVGGGYSVGPRSNSLQVIGPLKCLDSLFCQPLVPTI